MPSSGYLMADLLGHPDLKEDEVARLILREMEAARDHGLFIEWLECFVGAWEQTKDPVVAACAGGQEWDF